MIFRQNPIIQSSNTHQNCPNALSSNIKELDYSTKEYELDINDIQRY